MALLKLLIIILYLVRARQIIGYRAKAIRRDRQDGGSAGKIQSNIFSVLRFINFPQLSEACQREYL